MANSTIPNLVAVTVPALTDLFGVRQSGDTRDKKLTASQLLSLGSVPDPLLLSAGAVGAPTYSFSGDPDTGVFNTAADQLSLAAGGVEIARVTEAVAAQQFAIALSGSSVVPELTSLSDPDTGFRWTGANEIIAVCAATRSWHFLSTAFFADASDGPILFNTFGSATVPSIAIERGDADSGIGKATNDSVSLIAGGIEALRVTELNSSVIQVPEADLAITAFATGGQVSATQLNSSYNVIGTVATTGDSVKLPPVFAINSVVFVKNDGVNAADVFPATGDDLGAGLNTAVSLAAGKSMSFIATLANTTWTQWIIDTGISGVPDPLLLSAGSVGAPTYSFASDSDTGVFNSAADQLALTAGGKEIAQCKEVVGAEQFIVSPGFVENNPALPALAFGNADTGFFESVDNILKVSVGGVSSFNWQGTIFRAETGLGAAMQNESASATNPTLIPSVQDQNSGIGSNAEDQVSIIGGGVELARFVEVVGSEQLLILNNDNTGLPDLGSLGDPDTGFNWDIANGLFTVQGGIRQYNWSSTSYFGQNSSGPLMSNVAGSLTVPTFCANRSDLTSGLGGDFGAAALVASSITGLAVTAANGNTLPAWNADLTITAFATGGQANATQLDAGHNVISTVATTGDSVKLPPIFSVNSVIFIKNDGVNAADVFPAIGDNLGAGLNTAVSLAAGSSLSFIATVASSTWTQFIVSVGGGGGDVTKVGTPVNNQVGVWTGDGTLEGDADLTFDGTILTMGLTGRVRTGVGTVSQAAFGFATEINTGIYRQAAGSLGITLSGSGDWLFQTGSFFANFVGGPQMMKEVATATNPTFVPRLSDTDSGIGSGAADEVNLIAGGLNCLAVREVGAVRQIGFYNTTPAPQSAAYSRAATIVESRALLASASATTLNNNNVLAALIADLQAVGLIG